MKSDVNLLLSLLIANFIKEKAKTYLVYEMRKLIYLIYNKQISNIDVYLLLLYQITNFISEKAKRYCFLPSNILYFFFSIVENIVIVAKYLIQNY